MSGDRTAAQVATTDAFAFYSDFWLNLHDALYWQTQTDDDPLAGNAACLDTLPASHRQGWDAARTFYREEMGERHHRRDDLMRSVRYDLADVAEALVPESALAPVLTTLRGAAPAYQACWWTAHDARNRAWITDLAVLLEAHGEAIQTQLAGYYQQPWPARMPVDVVSYASWAGANTIIRPDHVMMSSHDPDYQGFAALEMVYHEASHATIQALRDRIRATSERMSTPPPRSLWHALLFYTSGRVTQQVLADAGVGVYTPYMYEHGIFAPLHPFLEAHWQPYLDGAVDMEAALESLLTAAAHE